MNFVEAIESGFRNYVTFKGRAARSEYWCWTLFVFLVTLAGEIADNALFDGPSSGLFAPLISLGLFLPGLAVSVRRLHDLDRSGWWLLLIFTMVGIILLLIWSCIKGTTGPNRFGPDPLAGAEIGVAKKFDSFAKWASLAIIGLFAIAPLISLIIGGGIAAGLGCELNEGTVHPCLFMGTDLGETLYVMTVAMWFSMFTFPIGAVALAVWLIVVAVPRRRRL
jgi:uncharacterized membrane protein YhaH (DUF805 family)